MSRDFYELCYDQYKQEMAEADGLYQKAAVMLGVIPLLGAVMVAIGRVDIVNLCSVRVDVFIFYFAFLVATAALVVSVVFLFKCVCPQKYKTLASMDMWQKWRDDYQRWLDEQDDEWKETTSLDDALFPCICTRLAEAQAINAKINENRRKAFKRSVQLAAIALAAIAMQALFGLLMTLQGV
ncbi:hypothetical protein [Mucisphaera calidilacus]|uniref:Pycsar effector protein domain-containing protein n=1 Tax=Mucisphaera calidilacus TaxID=2527982 RepID=A0A518BVS2_9BACT|nr:hypothetical protein [Mucisphaera calidilacus]QDU71075.1 hypothetical protein Pan265_09200 [Mucisphaera calidilacus]